MYITKELFSIGKNISNQDVSDPYSFLAFRYKLPNYKVFTLESLIQLGDKVNELPSYLRNFIADEKKVIGIFNYYDNHIFYVVFRSITNKKFFTYGEYLEFPYGIFSLDNKFTPDTPIVLVEGLKDRDILSTIYPYVFALQSTGLSNMGREILKTLTNNVILLLDNDEQGIKGQKYEYFKLKESLNVSYFKHPDRIKDVGTILDYEWSGKSYESEYLREYYKTNLSILGCS